MSRLSERAVIGQNASVLPESGNTSVQARMEACVRVLSYRGCAVSFNTRLQQATFAFAIVAAEASDVMPMTDRDRKTSFGTLRGFIRGDEPDEPLYFGYSATLRIHGDDIPSDDIVGRLQVQPTYTHRKGERHGPRSPEYRDDAWHFTPPLPETEPLARHLEALWNVLKPHVAYLRSLKQRYEVDVFCGYRSNCDNAGIEVPHTCLELFTELEVPFGISIIIA